MSAYAVVAANLGKQYRLHQISNQFPTFREAVTSAVRRIRPAENSARKELFWALKGVSFGIRHGEITGIIGGNGAGKSTLLKILSRITQPTTGSAVFLGRVAALLEVGTGFHPELTGAENVLLNGVILGMKRGEVRRKFDEIVAFAGVEKFIGTAVKHYSSGMYLRLAFAVAAHLDPDILLVDEVLAVGDAEFQRKCLGKMSEAACEGRTVLFVSHNLGAVQTLCNRALWFRGGTLAGEGRASNVISAYLRSLEQTQDRSVAEREDRGGEGLLRIVEIRISSQNGQARGLATGKPARIALKIAGSRPGATASFTIYDSLGYPVTYFDSAVIGANDAVPPGAGWFVCEIDELLLIPGRYRINTGIYWNGELQDHIEGAAFLDVEDGEIDGRPVSRESGYGSLVMPHRWTATE